MEAAKEAGVFDFDAAVLYEGEARIVGDFLGIYVADAELEPEDFGSNAGGFLGNGGRVVGFAEYVYDFDLFSGLPGFGKRGVDALAEKGFSGIARVDGNDVVAFGLQIDGDEVAWAVGVSRDANNGDMMVGF